MSNSCETQKLSTVKEAVLQQINHQSEGLRARRESVLETRRLMSKATNVIRDFDDVVLLNMYAQEIAGKESAYNETGKELMRLTRILDKPYFARIDFAEEGEETEAIYIGRHSLFDEAAQNFHVYDWRAPISSMYYDYGLGSASFTVPAAHQHGAAVISGEILLKRHFQIEKGELLYFFDSDLAVEDDILRLELSKAADAKIKTIIHSIQREQNTAIRSEADTVLVFGPAGSGKTSVGLHRLAYLLYRHRATLSSGRVRIFSPSTVFTSYIEGIIPELGEEDVLHLDFPLLLTQHDQRPFKDGYELIEHLGLFPQNNPRKAWLAHKYSSAFVDHLENVVRGHSPSFSEDVYFFRDKICEAARLESLYADRTAASTLASKTARVLDYVNRCFSEYYKANKKEITALFESIAQDDLTDHEARMRFEQEQHIVIADLRNRLSPAPQKLYERALKTWPHRAGLSMQYIHESLRQERLCFEDALAMFYIGILTGRIAPDKTVKHILLDEAQDACPLQHRILQKLYPASHFTVLADTRQALYPHINLHDRDALIALYPAAQVIQLTKSYRSTYEINRFAAGVLGESVGEASFYMRHGEEPEVIETTDTASAVWDIIRQLHECKTVGILLSDTRKAKAFYKDLCAQKSGSAEPPDIHLIADAENRFAPGVMVMAVPFAKGLEFDAVICPEYESAALSGEQGRKLLYLICTRALHRLFLIRLSQ